MVDILVGQCVLKGTVDRTHYYKYKYKCKPHVIMVMISHTCGLV